MKELLKFLTCGSVDDDKSTLIGRLLHDANLLYNDQYLDAEKVGGIDGEVDYANLLDGLIDERQQGITIDVAYRYFTTSKRRFIVADTPGHEQYTRNMAVGASFADLALLLMDASKGIQLQTRRHARICRMVGIKYYIFAVNKMDLINYSEEKFNDIKKELTTLANELNLEHVLIIPVSAIKGDNIITLSNSMPWYKGETILSSLENIEIEKEIDNHAFVLPVQRVCRPNAEYRGYEGEVVAGSIKVNEKIRVIPSKESATIKSIINAGKEVTEVVQGMPVSITLNKEIDIARGDIITNDSSISYSDRIRAKLIWLDDEPLSIDSTYYLKLGSQTVPTNISEVLYAEDVISGNHEKIDIVNKNQIVGVNLSTIRKIACCEFETLPSLGRFLLINRLTNATSACGIIEHIGKGNRNLTYQPTDITRKERSSSLSQKPMTIWMTGLSGSGKSTLANALEIEMHKVGKHTMLLDGDNVRLGLNKDLGFSSEDREENIRRIAEVSKLMNDAGLIVLTAFISPFAMDREIARKIIGEEYFFEVYVNTSLEVCEERDVKGLYKKARSGEIKEFTGISSPYEEPIKADYTIDMSKYDPQEAALKVLEEIEKRSK